mgnify:CR=1 FL=1
MPCACLQLERPVNSLALFLSLIGFSVSNDIVVRKQALTLRASRIAMFATGAAVLVLCFIFPPNVFWLMMFIGTVFASSWGPVGFMCIWSQSITCLLSTYYAAYQ